MGLSRKPTKIPRSFIQTPGLLGIVIPSVRSVVGVCPVLVIPPSSGILADILDIGIKQWTTGSIVRVKVLGILAMLDAGETDWKVRSKFFRGDFRCCHA